jgi:hypothetical protein
MRHMTFSCLIGGIEKYPNFDFFAIISQMLLARQAFRLRVVFTPLYGVGNAGCPQISPKKIWLTCFYDLLTYLKTIRAR